MIKRRVRDRIPSQYSDNDQSEHCFIFSRLLRLPSLSHFVSYPQFTLPWADRSSRHLNLSHRTPTFIMFGTIILVLSLVNRCCLSATQSIRVMFCFPDCYPPLLALCLCRLAPKYIPIIIISCPSLYDNQFGRNIVLLLPTATTTTTIDAATACFDKKRDRLFINLQFAQLLTICLPD